MLDVRVVSCLLPLMSIAISSSCRYPKPPPPDGDCLSGRFPDSDPRFLIGDPHGQGSDLLGLGFTDARSAHYARVDQFDPATAISDAGTPIDNVQVKAQSLVLTGTVRHGSFDHRLNETDWKGATIKGKLRCRTQTGANVPTREIRLYIRNVMQRPKVEVNGGPRAPAGTLAWVYDVWLWHPVDKKWVTACRDPDDVAFPIPGYWADNGRYDRNADAFSFACTKRDVAQCLRHDYLIDATSTSDDVKLFEACTRMMRADYCGDGKSYTRDGSLVTEWDNRFVPMAPTTSPLSFEAAWRAMGVACYNKRTRYSEAELGRYPDCIKGKPIPICENVEIAKELFPGKILLFNASCETHPCEVKRAGGTTIFEKRIPRTLFAPAEDRPAPPRVSDPDQAP